jgi:hypothetical protein
MEWFLIFTDHKMLIQKKIMNMLLTLLFTCLAFSSLGEFGYAFQKPM